MGRLSRDSCHEQKSVTGYGPRNAVPYVVFADDNLSEAEALLSKLFRHRFEKGSGLEGHSFGNLFLAALTAITDDFSEAVRRDPRDSDAYCGRGWSWHEKQEFAKSLADFGEALRLNARDACALDGRAWILATCSNATYRDGKKAVELGERHIRIGRARQRLENGRDQLGQKLARPLAAHGADAAMMPTADRGRDMRRLAKSHGRQGFQGFRIFLHIKHR